MIYEEELLMDPAKLDELNRLLEVPVAQHDGEVLARFGRQFDNEYTMQIWIVNEEPEPRVQAVLWDNHGGRIAASPHLEGPVEGEYVLEFLDDQYVLWISEGPQTMPDGA